MYKTELRDRLESMGFVTLKKGYMWSFDMTATGLWVRIIRMRDGARKEVDQIGFDRWDTTEDYGEQKERHHKEIKEIALHTLRDKDISWWR